MTKQVSPALRPVRDPRRGSGPQRNAKARVATLDPTGRTRPSAQLPLGPALRTQQARQLADKLSHHLPGRLHLTITDNRSVMISVQRNQRRKEYQVRLHHLFLDAPPPILEALARYIAQGDRRASRVLNAYIDQRQDRIRGATHEQARQAPLKTEGQVYDLQQLFDQLNARYFDNKVTCGITWGRHVGQGRARRSIKVGCYIVELDLIRIHPGLDRRWIPRFYIEWVIYHEMLHAMHPIPVVNGRRRFHTSAFEQDERHFEDYQLATEWEKRHVAALLRI